MNILEPEVVERTGLFGVSPDEFPFTFLPGYARFLAVRCSGQVLFLQHDGLRATAPLRLFRNRIIRIGQWLSAPKRNGLPLGVDEERSYLEDANRFMMQSRMCDRLIQPPNQALFQAAPNGSRHCRFGTYILPLENRSEDEVFGSFNSYYRRDIRRALRAGGVTRFGPAEIPILYAIYRDTLARTGQIAVSLQEMEQLQAMLGTENLVCAVTYDATGEPLAGVLAPVTKEAGYSLYGGSVERGSIPAATRLAYWDLIRYCLNHGIRQFNFVGARLRDISGTKLGNIQAFKAGFGTTLREGVLWKMDLNIERTRLYEAANAIRMCYRWLKDGKVNRFPDIIDQELRYEENGQKYKVGTADVS